MKGWGELALLGAVVTACWLRTPVGALIHNGVAALRGEATRPVLAHFDTRLPDHLEDSLSEAVQERGVAAVDLPPGWTPALHLAVVSHLGDSAADALMKAPMDDPEQALETWAVGAALRDRAIRRARAAGELEPERYGAHRRFLPDSQIARADRAVSEVMSLAVALDLSWPVEPELKLGSPFGWRISPISHKRAFHNGLAIGLRKGHPIHAAAEGRVTRSSFDPVSGNAVVIAHGHGVSTSYCHGSELHVKKGEQVKRQALIMDAGSTGNSTGPHLHYVVRIGGRAVDPAIFHPSQGRAVSEKSFQPPKGS
jgi:murein DD-endopeptidase MepM/ murein hydrolase activator NlpD